jgi:hypothetical protein
MSCNCSSNPCSCQSNNGCGIVISDDVKYIGESKVCGPADTPVLTQNTLLSAQLLQIANVICGLLNADLVLANDIAAILQGHIIEDEGVSLPQRGTINFVGDAVVVTDAGGKTIVTIDSATGATGPQGLSFRYGAGIPSPALGSDGDTYVDLATLDLYTKAGGVWTNTGLNLKGTTGAPGTNGINGTNGTNGIDGLNFYQGIGIPSALLGVDDESYLDSASGDLYKKSAGVWGVTGNVYTGALVGISYLFNAQKTIEQHIDVGVILDFQAEFSDDISIGRFDYGNNWITDIWTADQILANISFGYILNFEVTGDENAGAGVRTLDIILKKNGVAFDTNSIDVAGKTTGELINISYNSVGAAYALNDVVTMEIATSIATPNTFAAKMLTNSIFFNTQL